MNTFTKYIAVVVSSGVLLATMGFVAAQTDTTIRPKPIRTDVLSRIKLIKDTRRQERAQKIILQMDNINQRLVNHYDTVLDKLEAMLKKVEGRAQKVADEGKDITEVTQAVQEARDKIALARRAVVDQDKKSYDVNVLSVTSQAATSDGQNKLVSDFRKQFQTLRDQMRKDLFVIRDGVMKDARMAVQNAISSLSQASAQKNDQE